MPVQIPRYPEASVGMAVLAASSGRSLDETAREMVPRGERIDPRPDRVARFEQSFRLLVDALVERDYLTTELAAKAVAP
jgi:D-ribulokinase